MASEGHRKVLICVDGSEQAENAFEWYLNNFRQKDDYVYGITVPEYNFKGISGFFQVGPLANMEQITEQFQEQHKRVEKLCADFTTVLRQKGIKGQCDSCPGDSPGYVIVDMSEKLKADCIIMGSRGLNAVKSLFLGSVSNYVTSHAPVPVSVIPLKKEK